MELKHGEKIERKDLKYDTKKIHTVQAEEDQSDLLNNIVEFNVKSRPRSKEGKDKKKHL